MTNTLLMRLVGPMQSWGLQSHFSIRDTAREPTKSGVLGLVCAALGIPRPDEKTLLTLATLRMGVRVDREGKLSRDFQTALNVLKAAGGLKETEPSSRYYLADAAFLVGLEGDDLGILQQIQSALQNPVWALFLGRKAFVPAEPIALVDGLIIGVSLETALQSFPFLGGSGLPDRLRIILETPDGQVSRPDQPVSFSARRFAQRRVAVSFIQSSLLLPEVS